MNILICSTLSPGLPLKMVAPLIIIVTCCRQPLVRRCSFNSRSGMNNSNSELLNSYYKSQLKVTRDSSTNYIVHNYIHCIH